MASFIHCLLLTLHAIAVADSGVVLLISCGVWISNLQVEQNRKENIAIYCKIDNLHKQICWGGFIHLLFTVNFAYNALQIVNTQKEFGFKYTKSDVSAMFLMGWEDSQILWFLPSSLAFELRCIDLADVSTIVLLKQKHKT